MTLLDDLIAFTKAQPDRHLEYHINCPACGHWSTPLKPHCSFGEHGWFCFVCGQGGNLVNLAERVGLGNHDQYQAPPAPEKTRNLTPPAWLKYGSELLETYTSHPGRFNLWMGYKLLSMQTIFDNRLGVGRLPTMNFQGRHVFPGGCSHERLIVPIFNHGRLVGLRARRLGCQCAKWIAAPGTTLDVLPLYNEGALQPGQVIMIVENCVDALWITQELDYTGLAIYSTSYWKDSWAETIALASPESVWVCLDNDLVGNAGAQRRNEFTEDWQKDHKGTPRARGPVICNRLARLGVTAHLFDWQDAPYKYDIGQMLERMTV